MVYKICQRNSSTPSFLVGITLKNQMNIQEAFEEMKYNEETGIYKQYQIMYLQYRN